MRILVQRRIKADGRWLEPGETLEVNWKTTRGLEALGYVKVLEDSPETGRGDKDASFSQEPSSEEPARVEIKTSPLPESGGKRKRK
jgi:hypothetical protein